MQFHQKNNKNNKSGLLQIIKLLFGLQAVRKLSKCLGAKWNVLTNGSETALQVNKNNTSITLDSGVW